VASPVPVGTLATDALALAVGELDDPPALLDDEPPLDVPLLPPHADSVTVRLTAARTPNVRPARENDFIDCLFRC
jgi:hypothetical protein